jgi:GH15 family glucan-1,4-alpha-glucosidase
MTLRIEDYAMIGDCQTAALVGRNASIDWLCWPRFDSDACFAALVGKRENGHFSVCPHDKDAQVTRRYRPNTLILETTFTTATGVVTVIDFMPPRGRNTHLVRLIHGESGEVAMHVDLVFRFGYGAIVPWVVRLDSETWRAVAGPDMVIVRTPVRLRGEDLTTVGDFVVRAGECVPFTLTYSPSHLPPPKPLHPQKALAATELFWTDWCAKCQHRGEWSNIVNGSLMILKALTHEVTGGIVAAPTTSLPEFIGGARNWDYRFCWLRDATLTLMALTHAGYLQEAEAWRDWLLRAVAGSPDQMQIVYGIAGERRLPEWHVPWLEGYERSLPVRIGNAAHMQRQLDVFGELMDALHQARVAGVPHAEAGWALEIALLDHLASIWQEPDDGVWENRGARRHFTFSKVMAWVAFDRAIRSARQFGLKGPIERWERLRTQIHADVCTNGFDRQLDSFVRSYGAKTLDASLLLIPAVGFLPPQDPRVCATVTMVEKTLMRDGLVLRYDTEISDDGLPPGENAFLACSFWLVDAYVLLGRERDAQELFERLIGLRNDVGLLSEEYDVQQRRMTGNFPQAFSHIGLLNSAFNLTRARKPAVERARAGA